MITAFAIALFVVIGGAAVLVDRSRAEAARLRLLVEMSERLQLSPTIDDAMSVVPFFAARLFPRLEGAVFVNRNGAVRLATSWSSACEEDSLEMRACNALMLGTTYVATRGGDPACEHSIVSTDAATICVPMLDAGEPFGVMVLRAPGGTLPPGI